MTKISLSLKDQNEKWNENLVTKTIFKLNGCIPLSSSKKSGPELMWFCRVINSFPSSFLNPENESTLVWGESLFLCFSFKASTWSSSGCVFLVRLYASGGGEKAPLFDAANTGKLLAFSRMWSNTVRSVMILHSSSSSLPVTGSAATILSYFRKKSRGGI